MSYSEEKLKVMNMVKEGKLTAEEAIKLLEALDENEAKDSYQQNTTKTKQNEFNEEINKMRDRLSGWKKEFKDNFNQKDFDKAIEEITVKAEKVGKNVASATLGVTDRLLDCVESFVGTNVFNVFGAYNLLEKTYEAPVYEGQSLEINALNGSIIIKKHLEDSVIIKSRARSSNNNIDALQTFTNEDGVIALRQNNIANMSVSHEVYIPQIKFNSIKLFSANGKIYVEDAIGTNIEVITTNGHVEVMGLNMDSVKIKSRNGRLAASYITSQDIKLETSNAPIEIKHAKVSKIQAETKNARVSVENVQNLNNIEEIEMELKSTNAPIKVNFNDMDPRGYKVKGRTTNGGINVLIPQLTYHNVNRAGIGGTFVEAESLNYNVMSQRVYVNAETTNGTIEVAQ